MQTNGLTNFVSATIRLALLFLFVAVCLIVLDWVLLWQTETGLRYLPELFGVLMAPMFVAIAGKNAADNFIAYRKETTQYTQSTMQPPKQTGSSSYLTYGN